MTNLDRTPRNTNLLVWHTKLWLIDHGAALYFQHDWRDYAVRAASPFALVKDHVLLPFASELERVDAGLAALLTPPRLAEIVALIPDEWLLDEPSFASKAEARAAYLHYFSLRLTAPRGFVTEAARAHAQHL